MGQADLSGAQPSTVAGRPAYTVRIAPKHDGGLIGAAELAWDAASGTPLRAAVYASGAAKPVLELTATDISFGKVDAAALGVTAPRGAKMTTVDLGDAAHRAPAAGTGRPSAARAPSSARVPFRLERPGPARRAPPARGAPRRLRHGHRAPW